VEQEGLNAMDAITNFIMQYGFFLGIPLLFIGIVIWVYRPGSKKRYQADANLPFYGDKKK
jgi:cbb3-type cytochrome oxidase subunit 3